MFKRGKNKSGQVTLFIIIAVVVVALGVVTFMLWPQFQSFFMTEAQAQSFIATQGASLKSAVKECVGAVSEDIIRRQGLNAGYYSYSHLYALDFAGPKVVVMYKDGNRYRVNELPSLDAIKSEFGKALELEGYTRIDTCLNNFEDFKRLMDVEPGKRKITPEIYDEEIRIRVDWPIEVSKASASATLQQDDIQLLIPLGRVWTVANDIVTYEVQQEEFVWNIENYIREHDSIMLYTDINLHNYPTSDQTVFIIKTRPYRPREIEYQFNLASDRA